MEIRAGAAVVLAAGVGSRMKSDTIKVLHPLLGRSMLRRVLDALRQAGARRIVVVVGHQAERVKAEIGDDVEYALQAEPLGTAHALMQAVPLLADYDGPLLVSCGDTPLIRPETFGALAQTHLENGFGATVLSARVPDPSGYGRILRDPDGRVLGIVEHKDADARQRAIDEINTATYCFDAQPLFAALDEIRPVNAQGEYYLPDALAILRGKGHPIGAEVLEDYGEALGINDRAQLAEAAQVLKARTLNRLYAAGVTVTDPNCVYVEPEVEIGRDTILDPFTALRGHCRIGAGCRIGPHTALTDVNVGAGAQIGHSVADRCDIGEGARVGPFARLAPGARVGPSGHVGPYQTGSDDQ